jgi:uncharacterized protein (TIGR02284 family)
MSMSHTTTGEIRRTVFLLHGLIDACRDAEMSFRRAAERTEAGANRGTFTRHALERARFAHELEIEVRLLGGPEKSAEGTGPHRRFSILPNGPTALQTLAADCAQLDDLALGAFEAALRERFPAELTTRLRGHSEAIRASRDRMSALSDEGAMPFT